MTTKSALRRDPKSRNLQAIPDPKKRPPIASSRAGFRNTALRQKYSITDLLRSGTDAPAPAPVRILVRDGVALVQADQLPTPRFPREMPKKKQGFVRQKLYWEPYWEKRLKYDDEHAGGERDYEKSEKLPHGRRPTSIKPQWARKARQIEARLVRLIDKGVDLHRLRMYASSLVWWYCTPEGRSVEARRAAENRKYIAEMSAWENRGVRRGH